VFEKRLNPPAILPQSFDAPRHRTNRMPADSIPDSTTDPTHEKFFSAEFTEEDMEWLKDHIQSTLDSASGEDAILYADIMDIPNEIFFSSVTNALVKVMGHPSGSKQS
jgi:hypothetical protein